MGLLYNYIGLSALIGFALTLVTLPLQGKLFNIQRKLRRSNIGITDERVKLMNELLQGIKAVKFYAWEEPFSQAVCDIRARELKKRLQVMWVRGTIVSVILGVPVFVAVITFSFYTGVFRGELDAARIFTGIAILNQLRVPMMLLPMVTSRYIDTRLGSKRIERFLDLEDTSNYFRVQPSPSTKQQSDDDKSCSLSLTKSTSVVTNNTYISIVDGEFKWNQFDDNPIKGLSKKGVRHRVRFRLPRRKEKESLSEKSVEPRTADTPPDGRSSVSNADQPSQKKVSKQCSTLRDINIHVETAKLTAIVGLVGSGKSSLFHAILGEMTTVKGVVALAGSVAYASEMAWIFNGSLRENIIFGKDFDKDLFNEVIMASGLEPDIAILPAGDLTAIGEKGINLSSGQKQRVSIARALYAEADVYLFDDPLSALDAQVSQHVFENCISNRGLLLGKLRLLVTNQVHVLPECDHIVFMESGAIRAQGTYNELAMVDSSFKLLISEQRKAVEEAKNEDATATNDEKVVSPDSVTKESDEVVIRDHKGSREVPRTGQCVAAGKALMTSEERKTGNVVPRTYFDYMASMGGIVPFSVSVIFSSAVSASALIVQWWLSFWISEETGENIAGRPIAFYLGIYFTFTIGLVVSAFLMNIFLTWLSIIASKQMHSDMLGSILHAPLTFFDTTPLGRVLSRFSRDMNTVDEQLPVSFEHALNRLIHLLLSYVAIGIVLPPFFAAVAPVTIFYIVLQRFFNRTSLELKRLDAISKSPIYAHFSETLGGLSTLRAYGKQEQFRVENMKRIDLNQRAYFAWIISSRWFLLTLELAGSTLVFAAAVFGVLARNKGYVENIALVLTYAITVTSHLTFSVRSVTELEGYMSSVERVNHYSRKLPQEAESEVEGAVTAEWPANGSIEFEGIEMRYRDSLPLVLKGLNLSVKGGEKIGVVGRTGSGKSSLMMALLRMVEVCGGRIVVDGVDLRAAGLNDVRKKMTIIPQDPVMFSGTIRSNLDPFGESSDSELWSALEKSHIKQFVLKFEKGLDAPVSEYGENLSAGQRQIICLARAMLRKSKILILDEASSSLDMETDRLIQETIRKHFQDATILTIAHRLFSLADYDRIAVMHDGVVIELGSPSELLEVPDGWLSLLVESMGSSAAAHFRRKVSQSIENP